MAAPAAAARRRDGLGYSVRVLRAIGGTQFRVKYADSVLGYAWSLAKPLALFTMLYCVFGRVFGLGQTIPHFPLYLLAGIVVWSFFAEATQAAAPVIPQQSTLLRKLAFPRLLLPLAVTLTSALTFCVNLLAIVVFVAISRVDPHWDWLLIPPLLGELYLVVLGVSLILCTLYVRFRDVAHIWDLMTSLLFYGSPIIYPVTFLPAWARTLVFANPVVQVVQDIRRLLIGPAVVTVDDELGSAGRLLPFGVAAVLLAGGLVLFKREEPWFAERL
jgi:ABC-2 type transport system permease protein